MIDWEFGMRRHAQRVLLSLVLSGWVSCAWAQSYSDVATQLGITHDYGSSPNAGGVSFFDFDQDGLDDLSFAGDYGSPSAFYRNTGDGFELFTLQGVEQEADAAKHILWLDVDNDGDQDLYITYFEATNRLYRNEGDLQFTDITQEAGLPLAALTSLGASWVDYDRDGLLDLYVLDRRAYGSNANAYNRLFKNTGDGRFTEQTQAAQVTDSAKYPFCSTFFDFDLNGWQDVFIAQDLSPYNTLLYNNGDGTYSDWSIRTGAHLPEVAGMGIAVGDCDQDGRLDLYVTNTPTLGNKLLLNRGAKFEERAEAVGVDFHGFGWSTNFLDYDNDQDLDLYVSGAHVGSDVISSAFYVNDGQGGFSWPDHTGFEGDTVESYSNAIGDANQDGHPDIAVCNREYPSQLWLNSGNSGNHWLKVTLEGTLSNRNGTGSLIEVWVEGQKYIRSTHCGIGFMGQNSQHELIGLGANPQADSVCVNWPSGHRDVLYAIAADQDLHVVEGQHTALSPQLQVEGATRICTGDSVQLSAGIYSRHLNYLWSTGETSPSIFVREPGSYGVTITGDGVHYAASLSVSPEYSPKPTLDIYTEGVSCFEAADGFAEVVPAGGTAPYYIEWDKTVESNVQRNLSGGDYTVHASDAAGCELDTLISITEPDKLRYQITTNPSVNGLPTGRVDLTVTGGTLPYDFEWSGDLPASSTSSLSGVNPGNYQVLIRDANGCSLSVKLIVNLVTGIEEVAPRFRAYPNPVAAGRPVHLEGLPTGLERWELLSLQGALLAAGRLQAQNRSIVDIPYLAQGTYILSLSGSDQRYQLPWIIR